MDGNKFLALRRRDCFFGTIGKDESSGFPRKGNLQLPLAFTFAVTTSRNFSDLSIVRSNSLELETLNHLN